MFNHILCVLFPIVVLEYLFVISEKCFHPLFLGKIEDSNFIPPFFNDPIFLSFKDSSSTFGGDVGKKPWEIGWAFQMFYSVDWVVEFVVAHTSQIDFQSIQGFYHILASILSRKQWWWESISWEHCQCLSFSVLVQQSTEVSGASFRLTGLGLNIVYIVEM